MWPGVYGSISRKYCSTLNSDTNEYKNYQKFLRKNRNNPPYSYLPQELPAGHSQYANVSCPSGQNGEYTFSDAVGDPNSDLTEDLAEENYQRLVRIFTSNPEIGRFSAFFGGVGCASNGSGSQQDFVNRLKGFLPASLQPKFLEFAKAVSAQEKKEFEVRKQRFEKSNRASPNEPLRKPVDFVDANGDDDGDYYSMMPLLFAAQQSGVPIDGLSMGFDQGTYDFSNPGDSMMAQMLDRLSSQDFDCDRLKTASRNSLQSLSANPPAANACSPIAGSQPLSESNQASLRLINRLSRAPSGPPLALRLCISCHVFGNAPGIPFDNSASLRQALSKPSALNPKKRLIDEISSLLDSGTMPLGSSIPDREKESLKSYFSSLLGH